MPGSRGVAIAVAVSAPVRVTRAGGSGGPSGGADGDVAFTRVRRTRAGSRARREHRLAGDTHPRLRIEEPRVLQRMAVGIARAARIERDRLADHCIDRQRLAAIALVHDRTRIVVRVAHVLDGPVHARREVVLEGTPPPPDRRLVRGVAAAVGADDRVARVVAPGIRIAALRPRRPRLAVVLTPDVAPAPPAIRRAHRAAQPVVDQPEERRRVAFVNAAGERIELAERTLAANVRVDPFRGERPEVGAGAVAIEAIAADAGPRREDVLLAVRRRRHGDVVKRRETRAESTDRHRPDRRWRRRAAWRRACRAARASAMRGPAAAPARACWRRPTPAPTAAADRRGPRHGRSRSAPAEALSATDRCHPVRRAGPRR